MSNREAMYDDLIAPLVRVITRLAATHDVPFFATFQLTDPAARERAAMSSSWYVPAWASDTFTPVRDAAVPDWEAAEQAAR